MREIILTGNQMKRQFFNPSKSYMDHLEIVWLKEKWYTKLQYSAISLLAVLGALTYYLLAVIAMGYKP